MHRFYTIWLWYEKGDFAYEDPSNGDLDMIEGSSIIGRFWFFLKVAYLEDFLHGCHKQRSLSGYLRFKFIH